MGHCKREGICYCDGDVPAVRATCSDWVEGQASPISAVDWYNGLSPQWKRVVEAVNSDFLPSATKPGTPEFIQKCREYDARQEKVMREAFEHEGYKEDFWPIWKCAWRKSRDAQENS